jgi:tetratricopeptide (TPR) repeat protein
VASDVRRNRLLWFLAAIFLIKLSVVWQLRDHPLLQPDAGLDTSVYAALATRAAGGDLALGPGLYFVSPLYIYFLAAVLAVFHSFLAARIVQIALGTAAVGLVFVAARAWFGRRAAWIAAALAALTGVFTFFEALILQAALDPFLTAAALAALAVALTRNGPAHVGKRADGYTHARPDRLRQGYGESAEARSAKAEGRAYSSLFAGLAFGLHIVNRPNVLIPSLTIVALLAVTRRWRPALLVSAGLILALMPMTLRNAAVAGDWSPVSSHGGLNFFIGNNAEADGTYHHVAGITPNIQGQQEDARRVAERAVGRRLDDGEVSAYFYGLGWQWIREHPRAAAALFARKLLYVFNRAHIVLNYSYPFYAYDMPSGLALLPAGAWLLVPLGIAGLVVAAPRDRLRDYLIWASFVPAYAIGVAVFFVSERYRLPLLVPLCASAGGFVDWAWRSFRVKAEEIAALSTLVLFAAIANWPLHLDDGRAEERTRMAEQLVLQDRYAEAEQWTAKAEEGNPHRGELHFRVARLLLAHGQVDAAIRHFEKALAIDPAQPEVEYGLGQALVDANRPAEAIPHLRRALNAGVRIDLAGFDLARALAATGDRAGAIRALQAVRPANEQDADSWYALGQLAMELDAPPLAATFFTRAVAAAPQAPQARQGLGLALATMDRYPEAVPQLEESVRLNPSDPVAQLNLAVAYAQVGRTDDARTHAREALRLKPDYQKAGEFLTLLK